MLDYISLQESRLSVEVSDLVGTRVARRSKPAAMSQSIPNSHMKRVRYRV